MFGINARAPPKRRFRDPRFYEARHQSELLPGERSRRAARPGTRTVADELPGDAGSTSCAARLVPPIHECAATRGPGATERGGGHSGV